MTCVVAVVDKKTDKVIIGSDSRVTWGNRNYEKNGQKIWKIIKNDVVWVFGAAGSQRFAQIARYLVDFPEEALNDMEIDRYLIKHWVPNLIKTAHSEIGIITKDGAENTQSSLIIGVKGQIFTMDNRFSVDASTAPFTSIGSGGAVAEGIMMYLEEENSSLDPKDRIERALMISARCNTEVGNRFDFLST